MKFSDRTWKMWPFNTTCKWLLNRDDCMGRFDCIWLKFILLSSFSVVQKQCIHALQFNFIYWIKFLINNNCIMCVCIYFLSSSFSNDNRPLAGFAQPPWYNWNTCIVESGVKHHNPNPLNYIYLYLFYTSYFPFDGQNCTWSSESNWNYNTFEYDFLICRYFNSC
jgi:hypothetical protein